MCYTLCMCIPLSLKFWSTHIRTHTNFFYLRCMTCRMSHIFASRWLVWLIFKTNSMSFKVADVFSLSSFMWPHILSYLFLYKNKNKNKDKRTLVGFESHRWQDSKNVYGFHTDGVHIISSCYFAVCHSFVCLLLLLLLPLWMSMLLRVTRFFHFAFFKFRHFLPHSIDEKEKKSTNNKTMCMCYASKPLEKWNNNKKRTFCVCLMTYFFSGHTSDFVCVFFMIALHHVKTISISSHIARLRFFNIHQASENRVYYIKMCCLYVSLLPHSVFIVDSFCVWSVGN